MSSDSQVAHRRTRERLAEQRDDERTLRDVMAGRDDALGAYARLRTRFLRLQDEHLELRARFDDEARVHSRLCADFMRLLRRTSEAA